MSRQGGDDTGHWEAVAATKWGRYISDAEERIITGSARAAPRPLQALDIGCGAGRWTEMIMRDGWSVVAVDVQPDAVALCSSRNPGAVCHVVDPQTESLPGQDDAFSLILCIEVVAVAHASWFPREAARILRRDGRLVLIRLFDLRRAPSGSSLTIGGCAGCNATVLGAGSSLGSESHRRRVSPA